MATDDERREVAERLRSFVTDDSVYADVDACHVLYTIGLYYKDIDRIYFSGIDVARLADLIDPDCEDGRYEGVRTARPVDRGALLELADEMEEFGNLPVKHPGVRVLHNDDFSRELGYARRIREACGEVPDGE